MRSVSRIDMYRGGIKNKELGLWLDVVYEPMYLLVSLLQLNALVVGNGSYILRPYGHDLYSPTSPFLR